MLALATSVGSGVIRVCGRFFVASGGGRTVAFTPVGHSCALSFAGRRGEETRDRITQPTASRGSRLAADQSPGRISGRPPGMRYPMIMLEWSQCPAVERQPEKVSGAWLFRGTRVPVRALFENLEAGARVDDFLDWFPGVQRDQVEAVLQHEA